MLFNININCSLHHYFMYLEKWWQLNSDTLGILICFTNSDMLKCENEIMHISMKYDNHFICLYKILPQILKVCSNLMKQCLHVKKKSTKSTFSTTSFLDKSF